MKTQHPVYIIVFKMITSDGDVEPPSVSLPGHKLKTEAYFKCLEEVVLHWIRKVTARRCFCVGREIISANTPIQKSSRLAPLIEIPMIIMYRMQRQTKLLVTPEMNLRHG